MLIVGGFSTPDKFYRDLTAAGTKAAESLIIQRNAAAFLTSSCFPRW